MNQDNEKKSLLQGKSYQSIKVDEFVDDQDIVIPSYAAFKNKRVLLTLFTGLAFAAGAALSSLVSDRHANNAGNDLKRYKTDLLSNRVGERSAPLMGDTICEDTPNWLDSFGDGCKWYEDNAGGCEEWGFRADAGQGVANDACCVCGGGNTRDLPVKCPDNVKPFTITLVNTGTNTKYDTAFAKAKARWESIIKCGLDDVSGRRSFFSPGLRRGDWFDGTFPGVRNSDDIDDILIGYDFPFIDGPGTILGQARSTSWRNSGSTQSGIMQFDDADFSRLTQDDREIIILHEMGHVLGLVNIGRAQCRLNCSGRENGVTLYSPPSGCSKVNDEYNKLKLGKPLELRNVGPGGQFCPHYTEDSFPKSTGSSELMTPQFEENVAQPLSRVSVAVLDDAAPDYIVDYSAADPYPLTASTSTSGFAVLTPSVSFTLEDEDSKVPNSDTGTSRHLLIRYH